MSRSFGEDYDPLGAHLDDPWEFYARAQREAPIFYSPVLNAWMVSRFADVKEVLRDGRTYCSANVLRPLVPFSPRVIPIMLGAYPIIPPLLMLDGEQHRKQRQPYADALAPDAVDALEASITRTAGNLIDRLTARGRTADLVADFANPLTVEVIGELMGFDPEHRRPIGDDTRTAAALAMGHRFTSTREQTDAARAWVRAERLMGRYARERRARPRDDLVSKAVAAFAPGTGMLTARQESMLAGELFGVHIAGHNTPSAALADGVLQLLRDREQWQLLGKRPELIPGAVEEVVRYCTPFHIFLRQTTAETELAGRPLPAGAEIAVLLAAANRDAAAFDRPGDFDITRPAKPGHIGFGVGAHYCVGAALARREIEISLRLLTGRLPGLRLVPDRRIGYVPSLSQRGPAAVPVTWS